MLYFLAERSNMADETVYQQYLRAVRTFVVNKTDKELDEELEMLSKVEEVLRKLEKQDPEQPSGGNQGINHVKEMCRYLVHGTEYIILTAQHAFLSSQSAGKIKDSRLPRELKPTIAWIKHYISLTNQAKTNVQDLYKAIKEMVGS